MNNLTIIAHFIHPVNQFHYLKKQAGFIKYPINQSNTFFRKLNIMFILIILLVFVDLLYPKINSKLFKLKSIISENKSKWSMIKLSLNGKSITA